MATDIRTSTTGDLSSDTAFRNWAKGISDSLRAGGCTATSDTGQANFTTITRVSGLTGWPYEIYRLTTDTKDSELGLRIKIEYGQGTSSWPNNFPAVAITVGTGSDGAGNLNGTVGTRRVFGLTTAGSTGGSNITTGGDGRLLFSIQWSAGASSTTVFPWIFVIERLRDSNGAATADGIYTFLAGGRFSGSTNLGNFGYAEIIRSGSTSAGINENRLGAAVSNTPGNFVDQFYLSTHHPFDRNTLGNPILSNVFAFHSDIAVESVFTLQRYGAARTYRYLGRLPTANNGWPNTAFGHTNAGIAVIWE